MAMEENEQGFIAGGLAGAGTGAAVGATVGLAAGGIGAVPGALIGAGVGFLAGGLVGNMQANSSRTARNNAAKAMESARRKSIMREIGAKQQADSMALAGLSKSTNKPTGQGTGAVGAQAAPGIIGSNLSISGTF